MLPPYDLLLGLALLRQRNQNQQFSVFGWTGVLVQAANKQILIERDCLKEIISVSKATRVIDHRDWLVGLMGYEGAIIPLVELRSLVQRDIQPLGLKDRQVLIISLQNGYIGLMVDKVVGSRDYWSDDEELMDYREHKTGLSKISFSHREGHIEICNLEGLASILGLRRGAVNVE